MLIESLGVWLCDQSAAAIAFRRQIVASTLRPWLSFSQQKDSRSWSEHALQRNVSTLLHSCAPADRDQLINRSFILQQHWISSELEAFFSFRGNSGGAFSSTVRVLINLLLALHYLIHSSPSTGQAQIPRDLSSHQAGRGGEREEGRSRGQSKRALLAGFVFSLTCTCTFTKIRLARSGLFLALCLSACLYLSLLPACTANLTFLRLVDNDSSATNHSCFDFLYWGIFRFNCHESHSFPPTFTFSLWL